MTKAIRIHRHGGPEVLQWEDIEVPPPAAGEARVHHTAIALNYSDINVRRGGFYTPKPLQMPLIPGNEAAGVVESVGSGVTEVKPGDRVAYVGVSGAFYNSTGAYAESRNVPAARLVKLPAAISDLQAAAMMVKGLTASAIVNRVYQPKPGDTILIHAAASGVGLILAQWSKHLGATVIGTVGSPDKAEIARANGCAHTILYRGTNFVDAVKQLTGRGVHAVFDGVGKDAFMPSLDCIRPYGMIVNYGNASGHVPPLDLILLAQKGGLSVSRPALSHYLSENDTLHRATAELFDLVARGILQITINHTYALKDAASAHRAVESRSTAGAVVLVP
ncbi:MAG: quinone oxidoreductase [Bradyrhizobiaceae bacterium]|nr:quinone oxidoreductase [Bradyrhizobiaceae bacterium]